VAEIQDFNIVDASNTDRWPEGMAPAAINNAARADEGLLARWYKDMDASVTSSGSANAYAITSNRTMAAYFDGLTMAWTANFTNTDVATLALNGLAAKDIKRPNGDALIAGDIASGQPVLVVYKSSPGEWRMLSPGLGILGIATQALMEAAASLTASTTPGRQHFHPGHPKAWGRAGSDGSLVAGDYNISTVAREDTGEYLVTMSITMSGTGYLVVPMVFATVDHNATVEIVSTTQFRIYTFASLSAPLDVAFGFVVFGDL
jgi:hypothetical protein